jgi:YbbR domain-containing protein
MADVFRRYIVHNFWLKVISLTLAFGLWRAVSRNPPAVVAVETPIEFQNVPENLEISSQHIPTAQIRLRGPEWLVNRLQRSDVHAQIDLSAAKPGERTFDLTAQQIRKPYGLEVEQVVPSQFQLDFDTRLTRPVEVRPRVVGNFATGYSIGKLVVAPKQITISGPRGHVQVAEAAITDPVDVSGTVDRATFITHAYVSDPMVQVIDPGPIQVTVIMERNSVVPTDKPE